MIQVERDCDNATALLLELQIDCRRSHILMALPEKDKSYVSQYNSHSKLVYYSAPNA